MKELEQYKCPYCNTFLNNELNEEERNALKRIMSRSNSTLYNATRNQRRSTTQAIQLQDQYNTSANHAPTPTLSPYEQRILTPRHTIGSPYASNRPMLFQQSTRRPIKAQPPIATRQTARPITPPYSSEESTRHPITTQPTSAARQTARPITTAYRSRTHSITSPATAVRQRTPPFPNNAPPRPQSASNIERLSQPKNQNVKQSHITLDSLCQRYPHLNDKEIQRRLNESKGF
eukprot:1760569-Rhodomonas_salina.1